MESIRFGALAAFLFSTLILANTSHKIIEDKFNEAKKHILYGYAISEYFGIYLFVLSIPLVVNVITPDIYLRIITLVAALAGLSFYQFMKFSVLQDHFPKTYKLFSSIILFFGLLL